MHKSSRKLFWLGLVFVFLLGLTGGAYLVLRSTVTHGELTNSTSVSQGKSSDELLDELLKLSEREQSTNNNIPQEEKNLTDEYLSKIVDGGNLTKERVAEIESTDFLASEVLPYLASNKPQLFPQIPTTAFNTAVNSQANFKKYFQDSNKDMIAFFESVRNMTQIDAEKIGEENSINDFKNETYKLSEAFQRLSKISVPKKYIELHKNILVSIYSIQKMYEAILNSEEDPLKSLIIFNDIESIGEFWKQTLLDYDAASKGK